MTSLNPRETSIFFKFSSTEDDVFDDDVFDDDVFDDDVFDDDAFDDDVFDDDAFDDDVFDDVFDDVMPSRFSSISFKRSARRFKSRKL